MSGMSQEQIARTFRVEELGRRESRRASLKQELKNLQARTKNEGMLLEEVLNPEEWAIHQRALEAIKIQQEVLDAATKQGYWKRLWLAVLGK